MSPVLHADELPIDAALVRQLVDRDLPDHARLPLTPLAASGSTNRLFRLGDDLLVRLPRQPGGGDAIAKERRWSPLMRSLPVAVPEILAVGRPGFGYPESWSVVRWIDGQHPPSVVDGDSTAPISPTEPADLARDLADVVLALREVDVPAEARRDPRLRWYRGGPLAEHDNAARRSIDGCRSIAGLDLDLDAALAIWEQALRLPGATGTMGAVGPETWYHGDLVAENLLLVDGRLAAVLDLGSVSVGDPTIDLHGAWEVLDAPAREVFRQRVGVDDATWLRGRAWALAIALGTFTYYWETMPGRRIDRLAMARNVLASAASGG